MGLYSKLKEAVKLFRDIWSADRDTLDLAKSIVKSENFLIGHYEEGELTLNYQLSPEKAAEIVDFFTYHYYEQYNDIIANDITKDFLDTFCEN